MIHEILILYLFLVNKIETGEIESSNFWCQKVIQKLRPTRTGSQQFVAGYPKQLGALSYLLGQKGITPMDPLMKRMRGPISFIGGPFLKDFFGNVDLLGRNTNIFKGSAKANHDLVWIFFD